MRDDQIVDDQCTVRYDPEDPKVARIEGGSKDERSQFWVGVGMFVAGAIGSAFLFRPRAASSEPAAA